MAGNKDMKDEINDKMHEVHPFGPVFDKDSRILILGSFPSVKSREQNFFYGHPQNRFWKVLAAVYGQDVPETIEEKKEFLLKNRTALWDVIGSCDIKGSSDSSISGVVTNDIEGLIGKTDIKYIFLNGRTAEKYYNKYIRKYIDINAETLPSTSPANASWTLERLTERWRSAILHGYGRDGK